jgi:hypothetical protein
MNKNFTVYMNEEVINTIDTIAKKESIGKNRVIESMLDMLLGNFSYEEISKHIKMMNFTDRRKKV